MADRFASRLARETQRWVRDGIISAAQAELLLARYPVSTGWLGRPIVLFALIGGAMIAAARNFFLNNWWTMTFPGLALFVTVICFSLLGDAVNDVIGLRGRKLEAGG